MALLSLPAVAQPPAVTSGTLVLQLDLNSGSAADNYNTETHTWIDLSDCHNDVSQAVSANAPTLTTVAGFNALNFDASAEQFLSNTSTSCLSNPQSTIFVVRVADPAASWQTYISLISKISDTDEMLMSSGSIFHVTWSGNFNSKDHQCYPETPDDKPVVITGVFRSGLADSDLVLYVNNEISTNAMSSYSYPNEYFSVDRDIFIGKRILHPELMDGQIMEILVYDDALSATDISLVNDYLKCKYNTNSYASADCNPFVSCQNSGTQINNIKQTEKLFIYPNPATVNLNVSLPSGLQLPDVTYMITDVQGRLIISGLAGSNQSNSFSVNTSSLLPGSYILSILYDGNTIGRGIFSVK